MPSINTGGDFLINKKGSKPRDGLYKAFDLCEALDIQYQ